jgi:pyruvate,water dikinase
VRSRLSAYPRPVVEQFERLLRAAQTATVLNEDHHFWIESRAMYRLRRVLLEFGRRLARDGAIDAPDDVFMLTLGELRQAASGADGPGFQATVAVRRAEMVEFAELAPRPMLGTASGPLPDNPLSRAFDKFLGTPPQPASDRHVLRGHPGAAGRASGPAKVVRSLADAGKLQPGDVLVAETTAPPWTPLFATAAAVVTDTGGILSHCAVVAREYRIPAVVGTAVGTSVIRDGQFLEVDGTSGVVRIGAPAAEGAD